MKKRYFHFSITDQEFIDSFTRGVKDFQPDVKIVFQWFNPNNPSPAVARDKSPKRFEIIKIVVPITKVRLQPDSKIHASMETIITNGKLADIYLGLKGLEYDGYFALERRGSQQSVLWTNASPDFRDLFEEVFELGCSALEQQTVIRAIDAKVLGKATRQRRDKPKPQTRIQAAIHQLSINRMEKIKKTGKVPDLNVALHELGEATISRRKLREHAPDLVANWQIKSYHAIWKYNEDKQDWEVSE